MVLIGASLFTLALVALALLGAFADGAAMPILMAIVLAFAGLRPA